MDAVNSSIYYAGNIGALGPLYRGKYEREITHLIVYDNPLYLCIKQLLGVGARKFSVV